MIRSKLQTLLWFLQRPPLYPELVRLALGQFFLGATKTEDSSEEMVSWCEERSLDTPRGLEQLIGMTRVTPLEELFPDLWQEAIQRESRCSVLMGGAGNVELLYYSAEYLQAVRVIETGVAYGWSSLAFLLSLKNRPGSQLVSTDMPYRKRNNDPYVGCVVPAEFKQNWHLIRLADRQGLPQGIQRLGEIDLCHYDSDKSYEGRMWAYPLLWQALRPGGFLISDDIGDNVAFRDFANQVQGDPLVVRKEQKYMGILVKPKGE
ncbi:class I SAM-dependent methyltransferase [Spirulina subsalsa FACHB-351]|uniref:Class I SAM-dependent methyltransferase n=1 Tax=Spirulina subsalsa FACHB-351 TaxID=234711 RepID=A0ABT3L8Z8_9CYAN|nr:class I SAM-dependent methyltransferase [Spirulina subsalsa]MCW6037986.1 class I SAM-dependent methyltransferase [Spirulina subsalsa FACHB-351]